ncbi:MAG: FAD-dependent oxidoreductase, partial [Alistipes sp.]|nr:FAD-dependent oxidoreductase [Alistipes sp.]
SVKLVAVDAVGRWAVEIEGKKGAETLTADIVLSAVGIQSNIEGIGLEELGVAVERGKIVVDDRYRTNVPGIYAIGDIVPGPALAHVASAEGICCVEAICGLDPEPVDYSTIPSCIFTSPEVASVGMTEQQLREQGIAYKAGRFPFTASGKATAAGDRDGFVKLLFAEEDDRLLGAHLVGANVTEMLAEPTLAKTLGASAHRIARTIHAHPTMNEGVMEAAEAALGAAIHL